MEDHNMENHNTEDRNMEDHNMADGKSTILDDTDNTTDPSEGQSRQPMWDPPTPRVELENPFITSTAIPKTEHLDAALAPRPTMRPRLQSVQEPATDRVGQNETRQFAPLFPVRPSRIRKAASHAWLHTIPEMSELELPTRKYAPSANHTFHQLTTSPILSRRQARPRRSPSNPTLIRQRTSSFPATYSTSYQLPSPRPLPATPQDLQPASTQSAAPEPTGPVNTDVHPARRPDVAPAPHVPDSTKQYRIGWHSWSLAGNPPFSLFQRRFTLQDANVQARLLAEDCCEYHKNQEVSLHKVGDDGEEEWIVTTAVAANERNPGYSKRYLGDGRKVMVRVIVYAHEEVAE